MTEWSAGKRETMWTDLIKGRNRYWKYQWKLEGNREHHSNEKIINKNNYIVIAILSL